VRDAGKYDGPLGVLDRARRRAATQRRERCIPFHLEVIGFSDEEGVRYQTTYLGSRALAGTLTKRDLGVDRGERHRTSEAQARRVARLRGSAHRARSGAGAKGLALGVVSGIAGQTRARVEFAGRAGHAGTVPMKLRRDALCAAAEFSLAVERCGVTATVGQIDAQPGASNVIPGRVTLSLDVRDLAMRNARRRSRAPKASDAIGNRALRA
jgi:allantoate deiminase